MAPTKAEVLEVAGQQVRVTNPDKVLFPALGVTKLDVVRFEGGMVAEITTFGSALFPEFGLPPTL